MGQVGEVNVYMYRGAQEELVMEKVDRIIPGRDRPFSWKAYLVNVRCCGHGLKKWNLFIIG